MFDEGFLPLPPPSATTAPPPAERAAASRVHGDRDLLARYHRQGDGAARDELVARFLPLARQLARRYQRGREPLDDLVQVASVGLVKAVDRFDPDRGTAFSSYAVPTILGELKRYFRDSGWAVHVPRGMQERVLEVNGAVTRLGRQLGRSPTPVEIADALSMPTEAVLEALEAGVAYDAVSLEAPRSGDEQDGAQYGETLGGEDERFELIELGATIAPTLKALPERDRLVLCLRFVEDLTQSEIAARIGVSQMHVSRLIRRALTRLRTVAEAQDSAHARAA
ncbi:MAG: SigB/SigF/SigG family RNA polymerase sigma factor [Actinomycetota bacterium]|nr:SigB/SigF/SigG family RNA polymerase sigma factor [Actinomycetota bacterium]